MAKKSFNDIYANAETISKSFGINYIALDTLKQLCAKAGIKQKIGIPNDFVQAYNKCITLLFISCRSAANELNKDNRVPLVVLRSFTNNLIDNIG